MIGLQGIEKVYRTDRIETVALTNVNLDVGEGEFISVMGPSGCGKSTLLNLMGLLDVPTKGTVQINGSPIDHLSGPLARRDPQQGDRLRLPDVPPDPRSLVVDNVEIPLLYRKLSNAERRTLAADGARSRRPLGAASITSRRSSRAASSSASRSPARSSDVRASCWPTSRPAISISQMGDEIMGILQALCREDKTTIVMVTHDQQKAEQTQPHRASVRRPAGELGEARDPDAEKLSQDRAEGAGAPEVLHLHQPVRDQLHAARADGRDGDARSHVRADGSRDAPGSHARRLPRRDVRAAATGGRARRATSCSTRYARDLPGVERLSIFSGGGTVHSYLGGQKIESTLKRTDGEFWRDPRLHVRRRRALRDRGRRRSAVRRGDQRRHAPALLRRAPGGRPDDRSRRPALPRRRRRGRRLARAASCRSPISGCRYTTAKTDAYKRELMGDFLAIALAPRPRTLPRIHEEFNSRLLHVEFDIRRAPRPWSRRSRPTSRWSPASRRHGDNKDPSSQVWRLVLLLAVLAVLFVLLPTVNLININVSRIMERASEIGVRKAFGASARTLVGQFIVENIMLTLVGGCSAWCCPSSCCGR